jgi:CSLREA domain-containing protein
VSVAGAGRLLDCRIFVAAAIALACLLAGPSHAAAEQFFVNSTADEGDAVVGNEFCETAIGKCTLRAAVEEANASLGAFDEIIFEEGVFAGRASDVVELTSALPTIVDPVRIYGRECETAAGPIGPCAQVDGDPGAPAFSVAGVEGVEIESLAVTGAEVGLATEAAPRLRLRASWFGIALDGSVAGNETGVELGAGSDDGRVGGEGPGTGNLFADSAEIGLSILGASRTRILGNRFGVDLAGTAAAANGTDLAIGSEPGSPALDNIVGTRVSPAAAATAACDGGCNLLSGAEADGVDLSGEAGSGPPIGTTVAGNQIGLDGAGVGSVPNGAAGVLVGSAPHTTVGGPRPEDANLIAGGTVAVAAEPGVPYLLVRGNRIGSAASESATPPEDGIDVDTEGITLAPEEAEIVGNEVGLAGGTGIAVSGVAGEVTGNSVSGAAVGIEVLSFETLVASNSIEAPGELGILVAGGFNAMVGNRVAGSGGVGILIQGGDPFPISGNVVGGDSAASENVIDGSHEAAIEILNLKPSLNEVARNRGAGNGGPFVDLVAAPPDPSELEPGDPNNGILPPAIASITETAVAGFAEPGATVRVFRKQTSSPGEIESFLGQASADEDGNWSLAPGTALAAGTPIAATQTLAGGTSELEIAAVPLPDQGQPGPPAGGPAADRKPPRTRVLKQPRRVRAGHMARFSFTANEPGSSFQCSLDHARFRPCTSPQRYRLSRPGKHLFRVRAIDAAGNVDPTPVRRRFEVLD